MKERIEKYLKNQHYPIARSKKEATELILGFMQSLESEQEHTTCDGCQMFQDCGCMLDDSCPECVDHHLWIPINEESSIEDFKEKYGIVYEDIETAIRNYVNGKIKPEQGEVLSAEGRKLKDIILDEYKKNNIVYASIEGLVSAPIDEFIKQPVEGLLYDLNRNESVVLTFINDPKWVNDFAVAKVIRKLYASQHTTKLPSEEERRKYLERFAKYYLESEQTSIWKTIDDYIKNK